MAVRCCAVNCDCVISIHAFGKLLDLCLGTQTTAYQCNWLSYLASIAS
jgi:hypothetical protein